MSVVVLRKVLPGRHRALLADISAGSPLAILRVRICNRVAPCSLWQHPNAEVRWFSMLLASNGPSQFRCNRNGIFGCRSHLIGLLS